MNEIFSINLSGRSFHIDTDAYNKLNEYLDKLKKWFKGKESGDEIISDIESRLAELFFQKINADTEVVNISMVNDAIELMGQPEDFEEVDNPTAEPYSNQDRSRSKTTNDTHTKFRSKKLYRDIDDRFLGGVCAGIAAYLNIDASIVRIIFAVLALISAGTGVLAYIILWILLPPAITTAQKLEMKGDSINISNIEKKIREEYEDVKENFKNSDAYKKSEEFFRNKDKKNKTLLIVVISVLAVFIVMPIVLSFASTFFHGFNASFHMPFVLLHGKLIPIILVLLVIGLASKSLLKTMLYIIGFLLLISISLKVIAFLTGGIYFLT